MDSLTIPESKASTYERGYEYAWVRVERGYMARLLNEGPERAVENLIGLLPTFQVYEFEDVEFLPYESHTWARVKIKRGYETLGAFITQHEDCVSQDSTRFNTLYTEEYIEIWCECGKSCMVERDSLHKDFLHQT